MIMTRKSKEESDNNYHTKNHGQETNKVITMKKSKKEGHDNEHLES